MTRTRSTLAALLAVALAPAALARDLEGVHVPDAITVDGAELALNGAGLRRATIFNVKVYVGALYLPERSGDPAAIVAAETPKSVRMHFVRDVDKGKVMDAFREGFEKNSAADAKALVPELARVASVIPNELKKGMELAVTYVPGKGTTVAAPAGEVTIAGKPFGDAMFRNWFGQHPADDGLKNAMLGR